MTRAGGLLTALKGSLPLILGLVLWQIVGSDTSPELPTPSSWWIAVVLLARNGALEPAFLATLSTLVISLAVASAVGFLLGLLIGTLASLRGWTHMLLEYFRAIPPPVLIPIVVLMLGYTVSMKIVVIGFAALWPVLLNTVSGVAQIRGLMFDVAAAFRLSWLETMVKIVIPATVPSLLLGLRVALPHTVIITLVVEMFTGAVGLGGLMITAQRNFDAAGVFGLLVVVGLLGFGLSGLFDGVERLILRRWPISAG